MDEDHARLETLLERVAETASEDLPSLLAEAEAETRAHFKREEKFMEAAGVPVFHCHLAQHGLLLSGFSAAHAYAQSGDAAGLRRFLGETLPALIEAHVLSADRVTASFLKGEIDSQGLSVLRLHVDCACN